MEVTNTLEVEEVDETDEELETDDDAVDYKSMAEKALADANKWKDRFKKTKAAENAQPKWWFDQDAVKRMVDESVGLVKFYSDNKDANQYQEDIEGLVAKWIERDKAFKYVIAEKDPSLLLDEAKKAQLMGNTALSWVPKTLGEKNKEDLTDVEIASLSDEQFEKMCPSWSDHKQFYAE